MAAVSVKRSIPQINSVTSVNLKKAGTGQPKYCYEKAMHVVMISFAVVFGLLVFCSLYFS